MMAPTREAVAVLNGLAQTMRMGSGEIDPHGPCVRVGEHRIHVGDVVATRHHERSGTGAEGTGPRAMTSAHSGSLPVGVTPSGYRGLVGSAQRRVAVLANPRGPGPWAAIGPTGRPGILAITRRRYHLAASPSGASGAGTVVAVRKGAPWP